MEDIYELQHPLLDKCSDTSILNGARMERECCEVVKERQSLFPQQLWKCISQGTFSQSSPSMELRQQLLDAGTLRRTVQPYCSPDPAVYSDLGLWKATEPHMWKKKDYIETAFVGLNNGIKENGDGMNKKLLSEQDIHTVSYEVGDEELPDIENNSSSESDTDSESNFSVIIPHDYLGLAVFSMLCCFWPLGIAAFYLSQKTNKASAKGDFHGADSASRQAFCMAVLSIMLGICTYIGAMLALVAYLSNKESA
ncbi:transmembrane protein 91 [Protopterus annectens]|uniref:transmembrane protein 91 n=1 Tax=Protopterus annectens TaxID=7888 RepID=UPI001CFA6261|nr:transmembrane protein 91 [Protopterus annectens]